mmetsp:Transcript_20792/g.24575  ORF Transcript_20792/g.24575 Transcript_20792/m.24575 type:complete len:101 (+) Transcript_20792:174-476(+)
MINNLKTSKVDVIEKRVAKTGYTGLEVYVHDQESSNDSIEDIVKAIEASMPDIETKTVDDWRSKQRVRSFICWLLIFVLVTNYYWPWITSSDWMPRKDGH